MPRVGGPSAVVVGGVLRWRQVHHRLDGSRLRWRRRFVVRELVTLKASVQSDLANGRIVAAENYVHSSLHSSEFYSRRNPA